jgi:plasmid replication initiation protein
LEVFRAVASDPAPRDAQDLMAYPFFSLSKSHRMRPIEYEVAGVLIRVEAVPEHGMATIWDADILIWAASQLVEARDAGLRTSRLLATMIGSRRRLIACNRPRSRRPSVSRAQDDGTDSPG